MCVCVLGEPDTRWVTDRCHIPAVVVTCAQSLPHAHSVPPPAAHMTSSGAGQRGCCGPLAHAPRVAGRNGCVCSRARTPEEGAGREAGCAAGILEVKREAWRAGHTAAQELSVSRFWGHAWAPGPPVPSPSPFYPASGTQPCLHWSHLEVPCSGGTPISITDPVGEESGQGVHAASGLNPNPSPQSA